MPHIVAEAVPRPDWFVLPRAGCRGVEGKVLLHTPELVLALLRFGPHSTIDPHPAPYPIDVICLEGEGLFSVDAEPAPIHAGQRVQWPANRQHCLWTETSPMLTLMVEHPRLGSASTAN
jgi:quercetin dioxygenase-like cupin family protein